MDKISFFTTPNPGFMGSVLLTMLLTIGQIHAGWLVEEQELTVSDPATIDAFGYSIAVSGNTAVIGAYKDNEKGEDAGAAYIFVRTGAIRSHEKPNWSMQAKLMASDAADQDNFGRSVAIEGDSVVIGTLSKPGSAYVYVRNEGIWSEQAKLVSPSVSPPSGTNEFGSRVGISDNTAVISGSQSVNGKQRGAVYVFSRSESIWTHETTLDALNSFWGRTFGSSIDVDNDNTILVGAIGDDNVGRGARGTAFIYTRTPDLNWDSGRKLQPSNGHSSYGAAVALDDNTALVGGSNPSIVFVRPDNDNQGEWTEQATLSSPDEAGVHWFGSHVAVSGDSALIGAVGAAYTFSRNGTNWSQKTKLIPSKLATETRRFGVTGGISSTTADGLTGNIAVVGRGYDSFTTTRGAAFAFDLACAPNIISTLGIPNNQWLMVGLPCDPGEHNTVAEIFGDEIPGTYDTDWVMFRYTTSGYEKLNSSSSMNQQEGYWIFQQSGNEIFIDLPNSSTPTLVSNHEGCLANAKGCFEIPLMTQADSDHFNLINYPFWTVANIGNTRVVTDTGACATGCDLDTAKTEGILHNEFFTYNGEGYDTITTRDDVFPLKAYWAVTLDSADGTNPRLLIPKP